MCKIFLFKKDDNLKRNTRSPFKVWIGCWLTIGCHCFVHVFFRWGNFTEGSCQEPHEGVCHLWPPRLQEVSLFMYQAILETLKGYLNLKVIYRIFLKKLLIIHCNGRWNCSCSVRVTPLNNSCIVSPNRQLLWLHRLPVLFRVAYFYIYSIDSM